MPSIISKIEDFDDKVKQVLGNLLRLAEQHEDNRTTDAVRVVLNAFDPAKDAWVNNKAVAQVLRTKLDLTAGFLGIPLIGPNQGVFFSNREKLAKRIVREIVALYPSVCNECNHEYQVDFGDSPPMRCYICLQGSHDCEEFTTKKEIQSNNGVHLSAVWLCTQCHELNNPYPTESKPKSKPGTGPATPSEPSSQAATDIDESLKISILQKTAAISGEDPATEVAEEKKDGEKKDEDKKGEEQKPEPTPPNKSKNVCSRYRVGTCPHGVSGKTKSGGVSHCKFTHPSRCKRYMRYGTDRENGCTLGKECTKLHSKLCPSSVSKMECLDTKCTHAHLKGTRRSEAKPKHGKKQEQSHNKRDRRESYRRDDADKSRERPREKSANQPRSRTKSTSQCHNPNPNSDPFLEFRSELDNLRQELQTLRNGQDRTRKLNPQEELVSVKKELEEERRLNQKVRSALGGRSPMEAILNLMQHSRQDYF